MTKNSKEFFSKRKKENFYKKAKKEKVRARSYYKLEQINDKFKILEDKKSVLDLGCAPGAWIEYLDQFESIESITGIDLLEVKDQHEFSKKVSIIEDDFNNIKKYINDEFDLILSDMAPEFSGDSKLDRGRTHMLNLNTLDYCKSNLRKGGDLIFKTFEGEDLENVKKKSKKMFEEIKDFKPNSSQKRSSEQFIICKNKLYS